MKWSVEYSLTTMHSNKVPILFCVTEQSWHPDFKVMPLQLG